LLAVSAGCVDVLYTEAKVLGEVPLMSVAILISNDVNVVVVNVKKTLAVNTYIPLSVNEIVENVILALSVIVLAPIALPLNTYPRCPEVVGAAPNV
jgi:hypothetical protein